MSSILDGNTNNCRVEWTVRNAPKRSGEGDNEEVFREAVPFHPDLQEWTNGDLTMAWEKVGKHRII